MPVVCCHVGEVFIELESVEDAARFAKAFLDISSGPGSRVDIAVPTLNLPQIGVDAPAPARAKPTRRSKGRGTQKS